MYYGEFENREDVESAFGTKLEGVVLHAAYDLEEYEGFARVLFIRDGVLYYVEGAHCSCEGLERQWAEEEISREVVIRMLSDGSWRDKLLLNFMERYTVDEMSDFGQEHIAGLLLLS
jgi:hypothetical protein